MTDMTRSPDLTRRHCGFVQRNELSTTAVLWTFEGSVPPARGDLAVVPPPWPARR